MALILIADDDERDVDIVRAAPGPRARTVEMHRARLSAQVGFKSVSEAVRFAIDAELVPGGGAVGREAGTALRHAATQ